MIPCIDWTAIATFVLDIATVILAVAAFCSIRDSQAARKETENRRRELAFRAVLIESLDNIGNSKRAVPMLDNAPTPDQFWWDHPLKFTELDNLLKSVWLPQSLFSYLIAVRRVIQVYESQARASLKGHTTEQSKSDITKDSLYRIDLFLKQLACYIICEAKRQKFPEIAEGIEQTNLLTPLAYKYGVQLDETPETTVSIWRSSPMTTEFRLLSEPDAPIYRDCRLEVLIGKAKDLLIEQDRKLKGGQNV